MMRIEVVSIRVGKDEVAHDEIIALVKVRNESVFEISGLSGAFSPTVQGFYSS